MSHKDPNKLVPSAHGVQTVHDGRILQIALVIGLDLHGKPDELRSQRLLAAGIKHLFEDFCRLGAPMDKNYQ